jgi:hypothetical protein
MPGLMAKARMDWESEQCRTERGVLMMPSGGVPHVNPRNDRHGFTAGPTTGMGRWAVGLVAAAVLLFVALLTVGPEDSAAAWVAAFSVLALVVAAGVVLFVAVFRQGERAISVFAAALVLMAGVLFVVLHSLFISD